MAKGMPGEQSEADALIAEEEEQCNTRHTHRQLKSAESLSLFL